MTERSENKSKGRGGEPIQWYRRVGGESGEKGAGFRFSKFRSQQSLGGSDCL
jgi:hypothetical protein